MDKSDKSPMSTQIYGHVDKEMKSEVEQSGGSMTEPVGVKSSEVKNSQKRKRRYRTAQYKLEILREVDLCKGEHGAIGAILRREGLYSSALTEWRRQRDEGALSSLSTKRGRKLKRTAEVVEFEKLNKRCMRLEEDNRQLRVVIEAQKKISEILGAKMVDTSHLEGLDE